MVVPLEVYVSNDHAEPSRSPRSASEDNAEIDRRKFVMRAGGFLVAAALVPSCAGTEPRLPGALVIRVLGLSGGAIDRGTIRILAGNRPVDTLSVPASGALELSLAPGDYVVSYDAPSGYGLAAGQLNPKSLAVISEDLTSVDFVVAENLGTVRVSVVGLPVGSSSSGRATVARTDLVGSAPTELTLSASGVAEIGVEPGSYDIQYSPPAGFTLAAGAASSQSVTVAANATESAIYTVAAVVVPASVAFSSDWSSALGNSTEAFRDVSKNVPWTSLNGTNANCAIVSAAGLDFPSANVFQVRTQWNGSGSSSKITRLTGAIRVPSIGESIFYRWYMRFAVPVSVATWGSPHPVQDGPDAANFNWELETRRGTGGTTASPMFTLSGNPFPNNRWAALNALPVNATFRFEVQLRRLGDATYNLNARVFDSANAQVLSNSSFRNQTGIGSLTLADSPILNLPRPELLANFQCGTNGAFQGTTEADHPVVFCYQGCVAIRTDDWCGPYAGGV